MISQRVHVVEGNRPRIIHAEVAHQAYLGYFVEFKSKGTGPVDHSRTGGFEVIEQSQRKRNSMSIAANIGTGAHLVENCRSLNVLCQIKSCRLNIIGKVIDAAFIKGVEKWLLPGGMFIENGKSRSWHVSEISLMLKR